MIENFNEIEVRQSGIIYNSLFEQIKKLYEVDQEKAGELAISAIELVLTGQISSDDIMVDMLLAPMKEINQHNVAKYENKVENSRQKKIREMKLQEIADLMLQGLKQREIGERLGLSQQIISYRVGVIKSNYPELLQTVYKNTNNLQDVYKNTNDTKKQNFVQICTETSFVKSQDSEEVASEQPKKNYNFIF